jgi:hypothetical protein
MWRRASCRTPRSFPHLVHRHSRFKGPVLLSVARKRKDPERQARSGASRGPGLRGSLRHRPRPPGRAFTAKARQQASRARQEASRNGKLGDYVVQEVGWSGW